MGVAQGDRVLVLQVCVMRKAASADDPASMDGHMPDILKPGVPASAKDKCMIDLDRCFGAFWSRSSEMPSVDMFTRLTFLYPECGDCSESFPPGAVFADRE